MPISSTPSSQSPRAVLTGPPACSTMTMVNPIRPRARKSSPRNVITPEVFHRDDELIHPANPPTATVRISAVRLTSEYPEPFQNDAPKFARNGKVWTKSRAPSPIQTPRLAIPRKMSWMNQFHACTTESPTRLNGARVTNSYPNTAKIPNAPYASASHAGPRSRTMAPASTAPTAITIPPKTRRPVDPRIRAGAGVFSSAVCRGREIQPKNSRIRPAAVQVSATVRVSQSVAEGKSADRLRKWGGSPASPDIF